VVSNGKSPLKARTHHGVRGRVRQGAIVSKRTYSSDTCIAEGRKMEDRTGRRRVTHPVDRLQDGQ